MKYLYKTKLLHYENITWYAKKKNITKKIMYIQI